MSDEKSDETIAAVPEGEGTVLIPPPEPPAAPQPSAAHSMPRLGPFVGARTTPTTARPEDLAAATDTDRITFGAIKAAYGWTDKTKLTRTEFLRLRDEWLAGPARKRG